MTSIDSVHPGEGSSSVALLKVSSLFSLWKDVFYFLGVVPDPMWGLGTGMSVCTDCKACWGKFVICDIGLYKINWIECISQTDSLAPLDRCPRLQNSKENNSLVSRPPLKGVGGSRVLLSNLHGLVLFTFLVASTSTLPFLSQFSSVCISEVVIKSNEAEEKHKNNNNTTFREQIHVGRVLQPNIGNWKLP